MTKDKELAELVSNIIEFIDYDIWKEIYLYPEEDEEARITVETIKSMISNYEAS